MLGSTHVVEQLSFSMIPSVLTFEFDVILGSSLTFGGPNRLFLGSGLGSQTFFGFTHEADQLYFLLFLQF